MAASTHVELASVSTSDAVRDISCWWHHGPVLKHGGRFAPPGNGNSLWRW